MPLLSTKQYDQLMGWVLKTLTRWHKRVVRISRGKLGKKFPGGAPVVWLTIPGRRSGLPRTVPLLGAEESDGSWVVAGSAGGSSTPPLWALNAIYASEQALADCWLELDKQKFRVRVIQLTDENERAAAYEKLIGKWKFFRSYAKRAGRVIPVFRLKIESNTNL
jgi:deazaflavin-dependent oxidoreductase (nitroreductase family)